MTHEVFVAALLAGFCKALDDFEMTINFWMSADAWDALEGLRQTSDASLATLKRLGYAHLIVDGKGG